MFNIYKNKVSQNLLHIIIKFILIKNGNEFQIYFLIYHVYIEQTD